MPEFLAEGSAIRDLIEPSRIVIGTEDDQVFSLMEQLAKGKEENGHQTIPIVRT